MFEIKATMAGNIWKINVKVGDSVIAGDVVAILESMKMEIPIEAEISGQIKEVTKNEGEFIKEGDVIAIIG